MRAQPFNRKAGVGFTLVELLVVISVIALLLAILMPSLNKARQAAYGVKCAGNMHNTGIAMQSYVNEAEYYPPSYIYPSDQNGGFRLDKQPEDHPFGYLHWSWFLFDSGRCDASAFTCPAMNNGGAPRTNAGLRRRDWEKGQADQNGSMQPNSLTDKQAPRMAYTGNAAVIPRNKFKGSATGMARYNRQVKPAEVGRAGEVIMLTEFDANWKALGVNEGSGVLAKSHRPITPLSHTSTGYKGYAVYQAGKDTPAYEYGDRNAPDSGLKTLAEIETATDLLDGGVGHPLNAVGRHHPGGNDWRNEAGEPMGGTANFLYCDTHVERKTVAETIEKLEWGKEFYSITGVNIVRY
jgi:prepilin-type N-terminal cleavage/methylation domain-containing protein/prepilin-type processing-associated H-X9-DG protein